MFFKLKFINEEIKVPGIVNGLVFQTLVNLLLLYL